MTPLHSAVALLVVFLGTNLSAANLEPVLGRKGKLLVEETFSGTSVPKGWTRNTGRLSVAAGALHASETASENHVAAFRHLLPLQDCAVQLDFKFAGATTLHLGFDPAKGELKKNGHLFSVIITPDAWTITEHNDKADPKSKPTVHARAATPFATGQWFTMVVEVKGNDVLARIEGKPPLRASAKDFHVKKPGLVFRVGGNENGQEALIDNVRVWALE